MAGMGFMIRFLLILLILSGCGNLPIAYIQNFSSVNNVIFGYSDYEITNEIYDDYEDSFMKIRFGRGPHAILILAYIRDGVYEWVGADDVIIYTYKGRIIRTIGLTHNFELKKYRDVILPTTDSASELVNLYNPDLYSGHVNYSFKASQGKLRKLEKDIPVNKIYESFDLSVIGWSGTNLYFQNQTTMQIEGLEQEIHPRLPKLKVEYYLKY